MKLSEAIILGSLIRPQAFGISFDGKGTCAWGAADEAMGAEVSFSMHMNRQGGVFRPGWEWAGKTITRCPVCHEEKRLSHIISVHLNDSHRWTRERIAEWVATQEAIYVPEQSPIEKVECVTG